MTRRPLGKILLEGDFILPRDLTSAIDEQKKTGGRLGDILVRMGAVEPRELKAVLAIQNDLASLDDAVKVGAGAHLLLGELLLKAKRLTPDQLDFSLREQRRTGENLGEVFIRHGLLMENELQAVLAFQRSQRGEVPGSEKLRLGEILVAIGEITREQLEDVLARQTHSPKNIGDLLVEAGYAESGQIAYGLKLQQKLLTAALIAVLSLSVIFGAGEAYCGEVSGAKTVITATVSERTSIDVISQVPELIVTNAHIQKGFVDVPLASKLKVKTDSPDGYILVFSVLSGSYHLFYGVHIRVGGREATIPAGGGWISQPYVQGGVTLDLNYRFALTKGAQPGTYNWPLMVSVLSR